MAATTTLTLTTAWQSLGTGSLEVQSNNQSQTRFAISDTAPAATAVGFFLQGNDPQVVQTTSQVWARAFAVPTGRPAPIVTYAPVTSAGGGSGSSSSTITSPTGSNTKAQSVSVTYATDQLLPAFASPPVLGAGTNAIGSITNTAFGISGSLPAGTNAIGSITNTAFGISGTLPAFASPPTFNLGTAPTLSVQQADARATNQSLASGTANAAVTVALANGEGVVGWTVTGLTASGATLTAEGSNDGGTTWSPINLLAPSTGVLSTTITADGNYRINAGGHTNARLRVSTTGTGTVTVAYSASSVASLIGLSNSLPAGANTIGVVNQGSAAALAAAWPTYLSQAGAVLSSANPLPINQTQLAGTALGAPTNYGTAPNGVVLGVNAYITNPVFVNQNTGNPTATWGVVSGVTAASGGITSFSRIPSSAATTNLTTAKASVGRVYKITGYNTTNSPLRIKFYNAASTGAVTVGTTAVYFGRVLPPGAFSYDMNDIGWYFSTGITYALLTNPADTDTTAIAAGAITDLSVEYQ